MYSMVLRQLSPMQKGIQALHAVVEYGYKYNHCIDYDQWVREDKTMIVLDGGTSLELADVINFLDENNYPYTSFREPDLYNQVTAIAFLAPDTIWDRETYLDYNDYYKKIMIDNLNQFSNGNINQEITRQNIASMAFGKIASESHWSQTVFGTSLDEANKTIAMRNLIYSKKLSQ